MATRAPPIKAQGAAIGGGYDMLTSCIGSAMQKTIYAKYFKSEAADLHLFLKQAAACQMLKSNKQTNNKRKPK